MVWPSPHGERGPGWIPGRIDPTVLSDADLRRARSTRIAALGCAVAAFLVGGLSFVVPARDALAEVLLLAFLVGGLVNAPVMVWEIRAIVVERRERILRRSAAEAALHREPEGPSPRSVAEARRRRPGE